MPKKARELGPLEVKRLSKAGLYAVGGVAGLHLQITNTGARSWILRARIGIKRRDVGLGGFPDVGLAEAREKARGVRSQIAQGIDPIKAKKDARSVLEAAQSAEITFDQAAEKFLAAKAQEWKNAKHTKQWESTLSTYAAPIIGKLQVRDINLAHVMKVLEPIWADKTETASRVRGRIESILDWATVRGYRNGENPARWKGRIDKLLAAPNKVAKSKHHSALPIDQLGQFMLDLKGRDGISARALEFLILTAARSGEVRGARWDEIDLNSGVWVIPAHRMKAGKEHRVPLSKQAIALLKGLPKASETNIVFPAARGGVLSDMALTAVTRRMKTKAVPHGFRSSFRDWAAERTNYPREVAEMALAHTIESKVEAAYRRGDLFEKRRLMMSEWARFCEDTRKPAEVIPIRGAVHE